MKHGWEIKKLTDICSIMYGYAFDASLFSTSQEEGMPLIRIRDVKNGVTSTYYKGTYLDEYIIHKGDFLIGMDGEFNIEPWKSEDALLNQRVCKIECKSEDVSIRYIYRFMKVELKRIEDETPFVTVKHLSAKRLNQINIPIPPLPIQERIVSELDCINGILEKKREQIKELDALAQSIFYHMFGDPIQNEKGWEVKKLGEVAEITSGGTPSRKYPEYFTGNINWYSAGELNSLFLPDSIEKITQIAIEESSAKIFRKNSLMVGMYDTAAFKLGILTKDSASNQACANVDLHTDNVIWLYFLLDLMKEEALKHRHGARQKNLNVGFIKSFPIPLPPLPLQQAFAEKIEAIEKQKELVKRSIAETETLLASRMQHYFEA